MKSLLYILCISLVLSGYGCKTTIQLAIPIRFSEQATKMEVKGWNSNKKLQFGHYTTSKITRGKYRTTTHSNRRTPTTNERVGKLFGVETTASMEKSKGDFQYSISDGNQIIEVMASESTSSDKQVIKTGRRWLGDFSTQENIHYAFSAAMIPLQKDAAPWQLIVYNEEHPTIDSSGKRKLLRYPLELGMATNGTDTVKISQIRVTKTTTPKGKEGVVPFEIPGGYELRMDDGLVGIINTLDHNIWFYNDLDEPTKLVLSAIASSLILRRISVNGSL